MNKKFETIMETVCDLCHWPYVCGTDALADKCLDCPAEKKVQAVLEVAEDG